MVHFDNSEFVNKSMILALMPRYSVSHAMLSKGIPVKLPMNMQMQSLTSTIAQMTPAHATGFGGADRSVFVSDPRKWTILDRWANCTKGDIYYMHFAAARPAFVIAGGSEHEVPVFLASSIHPLMSVSHALHISC